eukprot:CAMPEP_0180658504 /NCGR_PEP_ID=MMETSP1037_2-20121125/57037_1 /TAXON_ID=632150 /ORGANISM="Azadinium spinosum, Strain 3D9" /LENGTH=61 /DNA_ID=CAMNT_0022685391 /DNA_START=40 /DNA_END=221 /DNA_ORIENTATION=-
MGSSTVSSLWSQRRRMPPASFEMFTPSALTLKLKLLSSSVHPKHLLEPARQSTEAPPAGFR